MYRGNSLTRRPTLEDTSAHLGLIVLSIGYMYRLRILALEKEAPLEERSVNLAPAQKEGKHPYLITQHHVLGLSTRRGQRILFINPRSRVVLHCCCF